MLLALGAQLDRSTGAHLDGDHLVVGDARVPLLQERDPVKLPWAELLLRLFVAGNSGLARGVGSRLGGFVLLSLGD